MVSELQNKYQARVLLRARLGAGCCGSSASRLAIWPVVDSASTTPLAQANPLPHTMRRPVHQ